MIIFSRSQAATLVLVAFLLLSLYGWRHYSRLSQSSACGELFPMGVIVQVGGKVGCPGTYSFGQPVTVSQAVIRAGGLDPGLKLEPQEAGLPVGHGRLVSILVDSKTIAHPCVGWMSVPHRLVLGVAVDVNQASAAELALVPGISPGLAQRIVDQRNSLGGFSLLEDLRFVDGIGPASLRRLRGYLTVDRNHSAASSRQQPERRGDEVKEGMGSKQ